MASSTDQPDSNGSEASPQPFAETVPVDVTIQRLEPGSFAFDTKTAEVWLVVAAADRTAAECPIEPGGNLAEWLGCRGDEPAYRLVAIAALRSAPGRFETFADVVEAVEERRVLPRALPASRLAPLPVGAVAAHQARGDSA